MSEAPKKIWRLDCQVEVYYLELPPQDQTLADSVEYVRADKLAELKQAIEFFDKVKASSEDARRAVGRDHWDWIESAARKLVEKEDE